MQILGFEKKIESIEAEFSNYMIFFIFINAEW